MLNLNVTVQGDKVVIAGLQQLAGDIPKAVQRGLKRVGVGVFRDAQDWLNGAGGIYEERVSKKTGNAWRKKVGDTSAGGYPVPVRTKHLKGALAWLHPGETKSGEAGSFSAGPMEVVVYDSALYAGVIHEGRGSSAKFGPRPFLTDALARFNQGDRIKLTIEEEIQAEIVKRG